MVHIQTLKEFNGVDGSAYVYSRNGRDMNSAFLQLHLFPKSYSVFWKAGHFDILTIDEKLREFCFDCDKSASDGEKMQYMANIGLLEEKIGVPIQDFLNKIESHAGFNQSWITISNHAQYLTPFVEVGINLQTSSEIPGLLIGALKATSAIPITGQEVSEVSKDLSQKVRDFYHN
jgi:hypothetical protein